MPENWTTGPWTVGPSGTLVISEPRKDFPHGQIIATVSAGPGKNTEANADLIAAAPGLYEVLREADLQIEYLHGKFQETGSGNQVLARIRAALAKARGES